MIAFRGNFLFSFAMGQPTIALLLDLTLSRYHDDHQHMYKSEVDIGETAIAIAVLTSKNAHNLQEPGG
jgi:hypothetical protein